MDQFCSLIILCDVLKYISQCFSARSKAKCILGTVMSLQTVNIWALYNVLLYVSSAAL